MLEHKFQTAMIKALKAVGGKVFNVHGHAMQASGWPDLLLYHVRLPNGHVPCELKGQKTALKVLQKIVLKDLNARGSFACVARIWNDGDITIERWDGETLLTLQGWQAEDQRTQGLRVIDAMRMLSVRSGKLEVGSA